MLTRQDTTILGDDTRGSLLFWNGALAAVVSQLGNGHEAEGDWFVEVAFGELANAGNPSFISLREAEAWIGAELSRPANRANAEGLREKSPASGD